MAGAPEPRPGQGKSKWDIYRAVDMDLHQVLTTAKRSPDLGPPNKEMVDLAKAVLAQDPRNTLIVSCGGFKTYGQEFIGQARRWLQQQGIDTRRVKFETKPHTLAVIDDHGLRYQQGDGQAMTREVIGRLERLDKDGPDVGDLSPGAPDAEPAVRR